MSLKLREGENFSGEHKNNLIKSTNFKSYLKIYVLRQYMMAFSSLLQNQLTLLVTLLGISKFFGRCDLGSVFGFVLQYFI